MAGNNNGNGADKAPPRPGAATTAAKPDQDGSAAPAKDAVAAGKDAPTGANAAPSTTPAADSKPGAASASKKPAALIDLKATEVEVREIKQAQTAAVQPTSTGPASPSGAGKPASTTASTTSVSSAGQAAKSPPSSVFGNPAKPVSQSSGQPSGQSGTLSAAAYIKPVEPSSTTAKDGARPAATPASSITRGSDGGKPGPTSPATPAPPSGGGLRSAATHLAAGLAGGLLVLLGADAVSPRVGLSQNATMGLSSEVGQRLQALEAAAKRSPAPTGDIAQKLAAAEARLSQLDDVMKTVGQLSDQQTRLALEAKSMGEKLVQPAPDAGAATRLARLEETLKTLSAAAGDPQQGRLPQLAAITGRIADLEATVTNQLAALRKNVTQEVDGRLAGANDASEAARVGTQRVDRELSTVKTETSQLSNRVDSVKAAAERAELGLRGLKDEAGGLRSAIEGIKGEIAAELQQVARPTDVNKAVSPVVSRLASLEDNVKGVVKGEDERRANAERIVLALELGNLKRTVERGAPFGAELAEVRRVGGPGLDLSALDRLQERGVPTVAELSREFRGLAHAIIEADAEPANASWTDRLLAGAKSVVRIRRVDQGGADTGAEAAVARIEAALKDGRLTNVVAEAEKLPAKSLAPARGWLDQVAARAAVERAITDIERQLKASLGAGATGDRKG